MTVTEDYYEPFEIVTYDLVRSEEFYPIFEVQTPAFDPDSAPDSAPVVLLTRHTRDRRTSKGKPQSLHELLLRYEGYQCKEPGDHIYALLNLIGDHQEYLEADYTKTPAEIYRTAMQFMQKYDGLPQPKAIRYTKFLLKKLEVENETDVRSKLQRDVYREAEVVRTTIFDRGSPTPQEECPKSFDRRNSLPTLRVKPAWKLRNTAGHRELNKRSGALRNVFSAMNIW
jgi:hypothetical protein